MKQDLNFLKQSLKLEKKMKKKEFKSQLFNTFNLKFGFFYCIIFILILK